MVDPSRYYVVWKFGEYREIMLFYMDMLIYMFLLVIEPGAMDVPLKLPDKDCPTAGTKDCPTAGTKGCPTAGTKGCLKFSGMVEAEVPSAMVWVTFMVTAAKRDCLIES